MIPVSEAVKAAFNPNNGQGGRYVDFSVVWGVTNEEAAEHVSAAAEEEPVISRAEQIFNDNRDPLKIATFETRGWPLDGTAVIPPKPVEMPDAEIGLVMPDLSGPDGYYTEPQVITLTWPDKYSWLGFTIAWGDVPPRDFTIKYLDGLSEIHTTTVTGNTRQLYVDMQGVFNCNRVEISVTRAPYPYRRVRVVEILLGALLQYDKSNSEGLRITEQIDPLNERVPANELVISVDNFAASFNIFDPSGIYKYLQARQRMSARIGAEMAAGAIGWVPMGTYYLQAPELKNNFTRMDLRATDILGLLMDTMYSTGTFKTDSLEQFLLDVAADAGVQVQYPSSLAGIIVAGYIPTVSHAEAFRRIAQAAGLLLYANRESVICLVEPPSIPLQTFTSNDYRSGSGLQPSDDKIINTIQVAAVTYTVPAATDTLATVTGAGQHQVKYDPSTGHSISVSGGSLVSATYYVDNAIIEITDGTAEVLGSRLGTNVQTVEATVAGANEPRLVYQVKDNPLIQPGNTQAVAGHYLAMRAVKRRLVKMQYRGYPYVETGDCIDFDTGAIATQAFILARHELRLAGGMTGTVEAREAP